MVTLPVNPYTKRNSSFACSGSSCDSQSISRSGSHLKRNYLKRSSTPLFRGGSLAPNTGIGVSENSATLPRTVLKPFPALGIFEICLVVSRPSKLSQASAAFHVTPIKALCRAGYMHMYELLAS